MNRPETLSSSASTAYRYDADAADAKASSHDTVGFSRVGYELREPGFDNSDLLDVSGRTVVITGATNGLGRAAAQRLALLGARVVLLARDAARGDATVREIAEQTGNENLALVVCDVSSMESVRAAAAQLLAQESRIDVLINNAGVLQNERQYSVDGYDLVLATNLLGGFLLVELLRERLLESAPSRVIEVSSGGMYYQRINTADLHTREGDYVGNEVYSRTKRAQVILTEMRAEQLAGTGVVCHSMHPGWAATPGVSTSLPGFEKKFRDVLRTPLQGADTIVWLASAREPMTTSGQFWLDRRPRETHRSDATRETAADRDSLWAQCVELTGLGV